MNIKWYSNLIENQTQKYLLKYEIPNNQSIIVCQDTIYHKYAKFKTYFDFYRYKKTQVNIKYNCFYEVIFGNLDQKIYFDLDMPISEITFEDATNALLLLIENIKKVCSIITDNDIMIFNSNDDKKTSFHIIIDNWILPNNKLNNIFFKTVLENYPKKWVKFIDDKMYKNIQQFRIYESHKWETTRVKILDINSKWILSSYSGDNLELINLYTLGSSLISNITGCNYLPFYKEELHTTKLNNYNNENFDDSKLDKILELCKIKLKPFPYKYTEILNNLIMLERINPSYCNICKRIHENQNPYLIIYNNIDIFMNCRRNDKNYYIGSLDEILENETEILENDEIIKNENDEINETETEILENNEILENDEILENENDEILENVKVIKNNSIKIIKKEKIIKNTKINEKLIKNIKPSTIKKEKEKKYFENKTKIIKSFSNFLENNNIF